MYQRKRVYCSVPFRFFLICYHMLLWSAVNNSQSALQSKVLHELTKAREQLNLFCNPGAVGSLGYFTPKICY